MRGAREDPFAMPIVGKLSPTVWGASTVGARDPANGLEAATDAIAAIEQGDMPIAKARLRAILSLVEGPRSGSAG
jgi:hypothetical protein